MATTSTRRRDTELTTARRQNPAAEAWRLLFELFKSQKRTHMARLAAEFQLSESQGRALAILEPGKPVAMRELADALACDASNVTGIVDGLEGRGLIERRPAERDRRVKMLVVTEAGAELRRRALARFYEPPAAIAGLSRADQRALRDILRRALET